MTDARWVAVVTGAGSGIGAAAAVELARRGLEVVLAGRDPAKLAATAARVRSVTGREPAAFTADFASLAEVRGLAAALRDAYPRIDVLANNAGALGGRRTTTVDGHELIMQVDHLAPYLLTHDLLEPLSAAGHARVIGTASLAEAVGALDPDDLSGQRLPVYSRWVAYGSAKRANILFASEASRRLGDRGIVATSFHPGVVRTGFGTTSLSFAIGRLVPFLYASPERGADTLVHLATHGDGADYPGGFFAGRRLRRPSAGATDPEVARRLWDASAEAVGISPDW
ncbi:MAG TPA: SDR family NAD(P)-dependent oxidoreductase [Mycobacteriales bacterium]